MFTTFSSHSIQYCKKTCFYVHYHLSLSPKSRYSLRTLEYLSKSCAFADCAPHDDEIYCINFSILQMLRTSSRAHIVWMFVDINFGSSLLELSCNSAEATSWNVLSPIYTSPERFLKSSDSGLPAFNFKLLLEIYSEFTPCLTARGARNYPDRMTGNMNVSRNLKCFKMF